MEKWGNILSHLVQTWGKRINHECRNLIHKVVWTPWMKDSSEVAHVWSRQILLLLIPVVHYTALPFAVSPIGCCQGNMKMSLLVPWSFQIVWHPDQRINKEVMFPRTGFLVMDNHSHNIICQEESPNRQEHHEQGYSLPHSVCFLKPNYDLYQLAAFLEMASLQNKTKPSFRKTSVPRNETNITSRHSVWTTDMISRIPITNKQSMQPTWSCV